MTIEDRAKMRNWKTAVAIITGMQVYLMLSLIRPNQIKTNAGMVTVHTRKVKMNCC
jgi:hypothetical protein